VAFVSSNVSSDIADETVHEAPAPGTGTFTLLRDLLPAPGRPQVVKASACRIERDVLDY
jgi:hypothetical protein